jgi:hypothetical protein
VRTFCLGEPYNLRGGHGTGRRSWLSQDEASSQTAASSRLAMAACVLVRAIHHEYASMVHARTESHSDGSDSPGDSDEGQQRQVRIGVDMGPAHWSVAAQGRERLASGAVVRAALRVAELALPATTLVTSVVSQEAMASFTLTMLHDAVIDATRVRLHLLGAPWSDAGIAAECGASRRRASLASRSDMSSVGHQVLAADMTSLNTVSWQRHDRDVDGDGHHHELPPSIVSTAHRSRLFSSLVAADDDAERDLETQFSCLWGWRFVNSEELEAEFLAQECRGPARFVPTAIMIFLSVFSLLWTVVDSTHGSSAEGWACAATAVFIAVVTYPLAQPPALGQKRLVALLLLANLQAVVLIVMQRYVLGDHRGPMAVYLFDFISIAIAGAMIWLPSVFPVALVVVMLGALGQVHEGGPRTDRTIPFCFWGLTFAAVLANVMRAWNRRLFAEVTAARNSAERWRAARGRLRAMFADAMPAVIAARIVNAGTRSMLARRSTVSSEAWLDSTYREPQAIVLVLELETPARWATRVVACDDGGNCSDTLPDDVIAVRRTCESLEAFCRSAVGLEGGLHWTTAGATWIVTAMRTDRKTGATPAAQRRLLADAASAVSAALPFDVTLLSGVGQGLLEGRLLGDDDRRYELVGAAVDDAVACLAAGTAHLL